MSTTNEVSVVRDVQYASIGDVTLSLDIYRPDSHSDAPTVIYLHGGGWQRGDKTDDAAARLLPLAAMGVSVVSVNYRLAPAVRYPAPVHDVKAAVRWVRARGVEYGLRSDKVGLWGASAGGYLATFVGLTSGNSTFDGNVGRHVDQSSAVAAVVDWFSPTDLLGSIRRTPLETVVIDRPPSIEALFGRIDEDYHDIIRSASPLENVHSDAPPFLIAHGNLDRIVPDSESLDLSKALARQGVDVTYCLIGAAGHEDPKFNSDSNLAVTAAWLRSRLSCATEATPAAAIESCSRLDGHGVISDAASL